MFKIVNKKLKLFFLLLSFSLFSFSSALAQESGLKKESRKVDIFLDQATIARGYTVKTEDDYLKLSLVPGILSEKTRVLIEEIDDSIMSFPWGLKKESPVLQFEFFNKSAYDNQHPFYIQFSYEEQSSNLKQVFFYDNNYQSWRPLPTKDYPNEKFVRSLIHLPFARVAVFSYEDILGNGTASWYKHKGGLFAASPDFPKGSLLRVKNLANDKFVDVEINDYGPDRNRFPDRIVDLDYVAFKKIADERDGLIKVSIEPLRVPDSGSARMAMFNKDRGVAPKILSKSALLFREKNGESLWSKEAEVVRPIASLSKIVSSFIFLQENNNRNRLTEEISYDLQDEKYNLQYFNKWELALINMNAGDIFTIKDAFYSALVRSANNMVETLVRVSGLDRGKFIEKMNSWAQQNGASSFRVFEPTGLDKRNSSSALDLAKLAKIAFDDPLIREVSITPSYRFYTKNDKSLKLRYNSSDLVLNGSYKNFKIIGSKTGYLDESGYCLITRAEIKGEKFLVVILNSPSRENSFKETVDLFNYAHYLIN